MRFNPNQLHKDRMYGSRFKGIRVNHGYQSSCRQFYFNCIIHALPILSTMACLTVHCRLVGAAPTKKPTRATVKVPLKSSEGPLRLVISGKEIRDYWKSGSVFFNDKLVYVGWRNDRLSTRYLSIGDRGSKIFKVFRFEGEPSIYGVPSSPKFSPNGRFITFFFGVFADTIGLPDLYLFDTNTGLVRKIQSSVPDDTVKWSKDSRYIAYTREWHSSAASTEDRIPTLFAYDLQNALERRVAHDRAVDGSFDWGGQHTLYYSAFPPDRNKSKPTEIPYIRPNVYAFDMSQIKARLVIHDGYRPKLSPDGKWIAFFGSEDIARPYPLRKDWDTNMRGSVLTIAQSDGTARKPLNSATGPFPELCWSPDDSSVFTIDESYKEELLKDLSDSNPAAVSSGIIKCWDIQNGNWKKIADLSAEHFRFNPDYEKMNPPYRAFSLRFVTDDGKTMVLSSRQQTGLNEQFVYQYTTKFQAVDTAVGRVTLIAQTDHMLSYASDWHGGEMARKVLAK